MQISSKFLNQASYFLLLLKTYGINRIIMKVLMVNGSPHQFGCTYTALHEIESVLQKEGIETEILYLGNKPIAGCIACGKCDEIDGCFRNDIVNEVHKRLGEFDGFVFGSPVYYSAPTGQIVSFLNRLFYCSDKSNFAGKPGSAIVSCRRGGASATFEQLNQYFTISNMPIVASQYWNSVHGFTPDDVRQDKEGLQVMRTLAQNMAWLLKCIDCGKKAGISLPSYEQRVATNFIR